jgi:hypothetical protein
LVGVTVPSEVGSFLQKSWVCLLLLIGELLLYINKGRDSSVFFSLREEKEEEKKKKG